jgi:lipopolysaccharide assembly protein A
MLKILRLLIGLVALIIIVSFAVTNRGPVEIGLAPLPTVIEVPVYGVFLFGLVVGVLVGGIGTWLAGLPKRRRAARARRRAASLEKELVALKKREGDGTANAYGGRRAARQVAPMQQIAG